MLFCWLKLQSISEYQFCQNFIHFMYLENVINYYIVIFKTIKYIKYLNILFNFALSCKWKQMNILLNVNAM